jgi:hypothetical protein
VVVLMSRFLPASLPTAFQNAPRWEKYSQVDNMVRDVCGFFFALPPPSSSPTPADKTVTSPWCCTPFLFGVRLFRVSIAI